MAAVVSYEIQPLNHADIEVFNAHFARHRAESGRDDIHFMPFAPDDPDGPKGLDPGQIDRPLTELGWQRCFVVWSGSQIVGHVDLKGGAIRATAHRCELGIGLERRARGAGLGRALMNTAIEFARAAPELDWLDLRVFANNTRARKLYLSMDFVELATLPDFIRIEGERIDDVLMTLSVRS